MNTQSISNLDSVLNYWFSHREYSENIQYTSRQEYCSGDFASLPDDLSIKLRTRLQNLGIHQLYSHQLLS